MPTTETTIAEIREARAKVKSAPWFNNVCVTIDSIHGQLGRSVAYLDEQDYDEDEANFIARAPEYVDFLLAELDARASVAVGDAISREAAVQVAEQAFEPAHTYASENADTYIVYDNGQRRAIANIAAALRALPIQSAPTESARKAAEEIAREVNGGNRKDCSYPPALLALLDNCTIANEQAFAEWLETIITRHIGKVEDGDAK